MPGGINPLGSAGETKSSQGADTPASGADFKKFLLDNLNKVNEMQQDADKAVTDLQLGKETDINKVMTAVEKADIAFQTLMSVRNKLVESYQEVLRMKI
ncbi:MAG: flagellar hook-basal body complex protein FliE [Planctomycetes bacterium]|nr:flagellar hook-basal body complex protein FliE [Planctomycetota bacterium]